VRAELGRGQDCWEDRKEAGRATADWSSLEDSWSILAEWEGLQGALQSREDLLAPLVHGEGNFVGLLDIRCNRNLVPPPPECWRK